MDEAAVRELEAPAELVEELASVLREEAAAVNPELRVDTADSDHEERAELVTLGLLLLSVMGHVNDVVDFRANIGAALERWRERRRNQPAEPTEIDVRVRRGDGPDEYIHIARDLTDAELQRVRDALADTLR